MGLLKVSNKNKDTGADAGSNAGGSSNGGTPVSSSRKGGLSTPGRFSRLSMSKGSSSPPAEGKQQPESPGGASAGGASAPEIEIEPLVGKGAAGASRKTLHGAADAHHSHSHKSFNAPPSSPYAVALGLVKPDKMYKEIDNEIFLSGAMTDRTHGNARRPAANDPKAIAQSRGPKKVTEEKPTVGTLADPQRRRTRAPTRVCASPLWLLHPRALSSSTLHPSPRSLWPLPRLARAQCKTTPTLSSRTRASTAFTHSCPTSSSPCPPSPPPD